MALVKLKDTYRDNLEFDDDDDYFDDYSLYTEGNDKVGSVKEALFEDTTRSLRYLIVDTGFWFFGKTVLLPIGLAHFDNEKKRVIVDGLTKKQVESLPEYDGDVLLDRDYEDRVRAGYRILGDKRKLQFMGQAYDASEFGAYPGCAGLHGVQSTVTPSPSGLDPYYDNEAGLYGMDKTSHEAIRAYQDRLTADGLAAQ